MTHLSLRPRIPQLALLGLVLATATAMAAPSADARGRFGPKPTANLIETLETDGRFGTLLFALDATNLTDTVANAEALTVFAPTDAAFDALPEGALEALIADPDALAKVLTYHVLVGEVSSARLRSHTVFTTFQGQPIAAFRSRGGLRVNGIPVINADVRASNGRAHVIGDVLLPADEDFEVESVVDVLALDGRFGTLIDLVVAAGLADTVINGGPFTLFAPTDEAFAALGEETLEAVGNDLELLRSILAYHIVDGRRSVLSLVFEGSAMTLNGARVDVSLGKRGLFINDSKVINFGAQSPNATVHVIDAVLLPPDPENSPILSELSAAGYTTLVAAIKAAGIAEELASLGPVTIFAPTNEAFAKLDPAALEALLNDPAALTNILLYHVVPGEQSALELILRSRVETVQGASVHVRPFWFFGVFVNGNRIVDFDDRLTGATVQGIDGVLLPPAD